MSGSPQKDGLPGKGAAGRVVYKVVLVGDSGVGKTSLTSRFTRNQFSPQFHSTVGVELASRTLPVDGRSVEAQLWDTPGKERYRGVMGAYYGGAHGILLVYDATKHATFESASRWIDDLRDHGVDASAIMLVGNKCDLAQLKAVSTEEARGFANEHGMSFMEVSALDGTSVDLAFQILLTEVFYQKEKNGGKKDSDMKPLQQQQQQQQQQQPLGTPPRAMSTPSASGFQAKNGGGAYAAGGASSSSTSSSTSSSSSSSSSSSWNNGASWQQQQPRNQANPHSQQHLHHPGQGPLGRSSAGGGYKPPGGAANINMNANHSLLSAPGLNASALNASIGAGGSAPEIVSSYLAWEDNLRSSLTTLAESLSTSESRLGALRHRGGVLRAECDALRSREGGLNAEIRRLEENLTRARNELQSCTEEAAAKEAEVEAIQNEGDEVEAEVDRMRDELEMARSAVDDGLNVILARANTFRREARTGNNSGATGSPTAHPSNNNININGTNGTARNAGVTFNDNNNNNNNINNNNNNNIHANYPAQRAVTQGGQPQGQPPLRMSSPRPPVGYSWGR